MEIKRESKDKIVIKCKNDKDQWQQVALSQQDLDEILQFAAEEEIVDDMREYLEKAAVCSYYEIPSLAARKYLADKDLLKRFAIAVQERMDDGEDFLDAISDVHKDFFLPVTEQDIKEEGFQSMVEVAAFLGWGCCNESKDSIYYDFINFSPEGETVAAFLRKGHFCEDMQDAANNFSFEKVVKEKKASMYLSKQDAEKTAEAEKKMFDQLANAFLVAQKCGLKEI